MNPANFGILFGMDGVSPVIRVPFDTEWPAGVQPWYGGQRWADPSQVPESRPMTWRREARVPVSRPLLGLGSDIDPATFDLSDRLSKAAGRIVWLRRVLAAFKEAGHAFPPELLAAYGDLKGRWLNLLLRLHEENPDAPKAAIRVPRELAPTLEKDWPWATFYDVPPQLAGLGQWDKVIKVVKVAGPIIVSVVTGGTIVFGMRTISPFLRAKAAEIEQDTELTQRSYEARMVQGDVQGAEAVLKQKREEREKRDDTLGLGGLARTLTWLAVVGGGIYVAMKFWPVVAARRRPQEA